MAGPVAPPPWAFPDLDLVAPGVKADVHDEGLRGIYVPIIVAMNPGAGDVGRYLDGLPKDRRIVFPTVISNRLIGMLERRGYHLEPEWSEEFGEWVECFVRNATP
jgi:hypothetical protein